MQALRPTVAIMHQSENNSKSDSWYRRIEEVPYLVITEGKSQSTVDIVSFYNSRFLLAMRRHIYRIVCSNLGPETSSAFDIPLGAFAREFACDESGHLTYRLIRKRDEDRPETKVNRIDLSQEGISRGPYITFRVISKHSIYAHSLGEGRTKALKYVFGVSGCLEAA
jgi:hypothetical protein